jgi:fimbrial chaperone protein
MLRPTSILSKPLMVLAAALSMLAQTARADLMLFPTRVVFEKDQRAAQVELINQGKQPETYRINLVNRRMSETGEFIAISAPGPGEQFADALLRYSPRQVTIPPGGSQTVRIMLRKPAELAPGEYRSHLQFDRVADASTNSLEAPGPNDGKQMGVMLSPLVGASIPLIVRHGDTQARINVSDIALAAASGKTPSTVTFTIQREGNRSVYGDLVTTFTPKGKEPIEVAKAGGVAVYVPNPQRKARMPLELPEGVLLSGGILQVRFKERPELGGKTLAESSLTLP